MGDWHGQPQRLPLAPHSNRHDNIKCQVFTAKSMDGGGLFYTCCRRSINKPPRAKSTSEVGSGTEVIDAGNEKLLCQIRKSSPSTFPSPLASPLELLAVPLRIGKFLCQIKKSLPSKSPSKSKSPDIWIVNEVIQSHD